MVNFFTQRGSIPGIANSSISTPPFVSPPRSTTQATEDILSGTGISGRDLSNILSSVQGTSTLEDFDLEKEFDKEFGTGELTTEKENVPTPDSEFTVNGQNNDNRLRLSAMIGQEKSVYGEFNPQENVLSPLWATKGLLFPYTPSVTVSAESSWTKHDLVHTNYDILSYQRTPSASVQISGKFTVQNQREGEYALAAIHFLRTVTKMYYGDADSAQSNPQQSATNSGLAGLPPPVLILRGYGQYMFRDIRVVCQGYNFSFDEGADLVSIIDPTDGEIVLPPVFTLQVNLGIQQSPQRLREVFSLKDFRTGELMRSSSGWF